MDVEVGVFDDVGVGVLVGKVVGVRVDVGVGVLVAVPVEVEFEVSVKVAVLGGFTQAPEKVTLSRLNVPAPDEPDAKYAKSLNFAFGLSLRAIIVLKLT